MLLQGTIREDRRWLNSQALAEALSGMCGSGPRGGEHMPVQSDAESSRSSKAGPFDSSVPT